MHMFHRITTVRMLKAGFVLTDFPDGRFWVFEKQPGDEANRIAAICQLYLTDMDSTVVTDEIVLQCASNFKEPVLYMDGFLWNLAPRDFADIVARLIKYGKKSSKK